jgi:hypothetical protein
MGKLWLNDFQSITRVCHVETPQAPFACIFKEVSEAESANPEAICMSTLVQKSNTSCAPRTTRP